MPEQANSQRSPQPGPIRTSVGAVMLAFGAVLGYLSHVCRSTARLCLGEASIFAWSRAFDSFRVTRPRDGNAPGWEQQMLSAGPTVLASIGGAFIVLWTLLLLGGLVSWLALHGYGLVILLATLAIGTLIGLRRARLRSRLPQQERWN